MEENKDGLSLEEMLAKCKGNKPGTGDKPGKGGVTEGPGAAELTFGKESTTDGVKWKEQALPPPALKKLKESRLTGVSPGDPKKGAGGPAETGALAGAAVGGGSANAGVVLPRHRGAVERDFDRPASK